MSQRYHLAINLLVFVSVSHLPCYFDIHSESSECHVFCVRSTCSSVRSRSSLRLNGSVSFCIIFLETSGVASVVYNRHLTIQTSNLALDESRCIYEYSFH